MKGSISEKESSWLGGYHKEGYQRYETWTYQGKGKRVTSGRDPGNGRAMH